MLPEYAIDAIMYPTLLERICIFPSVAISLSVEISILGIPYGATGTWFFIVLMSNDAGDAPWAPVLATVIGYPIVILCDTLLCIPALYIFMYTLLSLVCGRQTRQAP